jgi:ketosteroid isomerase-like protein
MGEQTAMQPHAIMENYVAAFNRGDDVAYGRFYAPDVVLRNGAGGLLRGAEAILAYYRAVRDDSHWVMTLRGVLGADGVIAAALASLFTARRDGVEMSGRTMQTGDQYAIESMVLYQLQDGLFRHIEATTLSRRHTPAGEAA